MPGYALIGNMGPGDLAADLEGPWHVQYRLDLLGGNRTLRYGMGGAIRALGRLGVYRAAESEDPDDERKPDAMTSISVGPPIRLRRKTRKPRCMRRSGWVSSDNKERSGCDT
jgi:hypothetical protein